MNKAGVMVVRRPASGPWGTPRQLATASQPSGWVGPGLSVADSGAVFVTWRGGDGGVWVVRRPEGGPWTEVRKLGVAAGSPAVAAWPHGRALLAYDRQPRDDVVVRTFVPGSGWSAAEVLGRSGSGFVKTLAVGPRRSAICAWGVRQLWTSDRRNGRWHRPVRLLGNTYDYYYGVAAAIDRGGSEFVGWIGDQHGVNTGLLARKPAGGSWSRIQFAGTALHTKPPESPILALTNRADDAIALFPIRTLFRPHGHGWTRPLRFGARAGVILPSGALLRMSWRQHSLLSQRIHLR